MRSRSNLAVASLLVSLTTPAFAQEGYYREPALAGDVLVFVSEGDLWRVSVRGGIAARLTTHANPERGPAISPDGKTVAFVGNYEGTSELYTMPLTGGRPIRRTFGADRGINCRGRTASRVHPRPPRTGPSGRGQSRRCTS